MKVLITGGSGFIGTNLVEYYLNKGISFINVDWNPPLNPAHGAFWRQCNIMDKAELQEIFFFFQPTVIIHLAARTDTDIYELDGDLNEYIQNTEGNQNVLECIKNTSSVVRAIITSSMFVCEAGYIPNHDQDFKPFTLYGVSKMRTEQDTRKIGLQCTWTIIRPQTIWGPWSLRYRDVMFKVMRKGLYLHPSKKDVYRSYGYVKNVVWQIQQIVETPAEKVNQQVFYVGDKAINLLEWVQCVSHELTGKSARIIPTPIIQGLSLAGDLLKKVNVRFPITSTRFNSMIQNYLTPIEKTYNVLGEPPYKMEKGVKEFVKWSDAYKDLVVPARKIKVKEYEGITAD